MKSELLKIKEQLTEVMELCQGNRPMVAINSLDSAMDELDNVIKATKCDIEEVVCKYYKITKNQLHSKLRNREFVLSRQIIMWYEVTKLKLSKPIAAERFNQNRGTAKNAIEAIDNLIETDKKFRIDIENILKEIKRLS